MDGKVISGFSVFEWTKIDGLQRLQADTSLLYVSHFKTDKNMMSDWWKGLADDDKNKEKLGLSHFGKQRNNMF